MIFLWPLIIYIIVDCNYIVVAFASRPKVDLSPFRSEAQEGKDLPKFFRLELQRASEVGTHGAHKVPAGNFILERG